MPLRRLASAVSGDAMKASSSRTASACADAAHTAPEKVVSIWIGAGSGAEHVDAFQVHQLAELLEAQRHLAARHQRAHRHAGRRLHRARPASARRCPSARTASSARRRSGRWNSRWWARPARPAARASSLAMSGRGAPVSHGDGDAGAHQVHAAAGQRVAGGDAACRWRPTPGPPRRTASPACTRLAASTPPTDSICTAAPPRPLPGGQPVRPAPGAWPWTKSRAAGPHAAAPVIGIRPFCERRGPRQSRHGRPIS